MTDLEILIRFRQAEADGAIHKLTKLTHECAISYCGTCSAHQACRAISSLDTNNDFDASYRR